MSVPAPTVWRVQAPPHPWRALRALKRIELEWRSDLPDYLLGATDGETIWMRSDLTQVERRCVLVHEIEHLRRSQHVCQPPAVERVVEHYAARYLLPSPQLIGEALAWADCDHDEAADVLWVTPDVLEARLDPRHLHPAERAIIAARVAAVERGA